MPSYQTVPVQLEPDQIDRLDELSDDDGPYDSRAAAVREAVDGLLEEIDSEIEVER